jgi:hypothetical protein
LSPLRQATPICRRPLETRSSRRSLLGTRLTSSRSYVTLSSRESQSLRVGPRFHPGKRSRRAVLLSVFQHARQTHRLRLCLTQPCLIVNFRLDVSRILSLDTQASKHQAKGVNPTPAQMEGIRLHVLQRNGHGLARFLQTTHLLLLRKLAGEWKPVLSPKSPGCASLDL